MCRCGCWPEPKRWLHSVPSVRKRRPADPGTGPMSAPRFVSSPRGIAAGILAMVAIVALANYAVQFPINDWLTWGALTYPAAFLVTDLTNHTLGPRAARMVICVGFALAVALSAWLATPRIAAASGIAFLTAQLLDVAVFNRLREQAWWRAPLVSSTLASIVDTALFFSIAFAATEIGRAHV